MFREERFSPITYQTPDLEPLEYNDPKENAEQKRKLLKLHQQQNNELNFRFLEKLARAMNN